MLKPLKTTFRGNTLFANIKNQIDPRSVIIYGLKDEVTEEQLIEFFKVISENSKRVEGAKKPEGQEEDESKKDIRRVFDFFDINILEKRMVNKNREDVEISRRLIITFIEPLDHPSKCQELIA